MFSVGLSVSIIYNNSYANVVLFFLFTHLTKF